jgi:DNA-binding NtrC family response regulator
MTEGKTILVIEDEEDVREPNVIALELAGFKVLQAGGWDEALRVHGQRRDVDLIVTDLIMPDRAKVKVFTQLRQQLGPVPVIVVSGHPGAIRLLTDALEGVVRWLQKPVDAAFLLGTIREAIDEAGT